MVVTLIVRNGNKMFGYSSKTKRNKEAVKKDLEKQFGKNIVLLKFKE